MSCLHMQILRADTEPVHQLQHLQASMYPVQKMQHLQLGGELTFEALACQCKVHAKFPWKPGQEESCPDVHKEANAALWHRKKAPAEQANAA